MDEFRDAWCVELYDPLVQIQLDAIDASGTAAFGELPGYTLDGAKLDELLKHIPGIEVAGVPYQDKAGKSWHKKLENHDFELFKRAMRHYNGDNAGTIIGRIEAKIEASTNLLHIRIHIMGANEAENLMEEMTYSGRYLVHWAPPDDTRIGN